MKLRLFVCLLFFLCYTQETIGENVVLVGSDWCPYICTQSDNPNVLAEKPGYIVDIIQYALKGNKISYESPSWKRSILETRKGTYHAIVGIYISVAPDFVYPENEMGYSRMCFYVKQDNPWKYTGIKSLSKVVLGVVDGYYYDEGDVDAYIKANLNNTSKIESVPGTRGLIQNLEKMLLGRITAIIDDYQVVEYTTSLHKLTKEFKLAGCLQGLNVHVGFSPAKSQSGEYAARVSEAVVKLRRSGELKKILENYSIKDWKE